jgi:SAM-dependent methyltransferase
MQDTGERYLPEINAADLTDAYEHWHRYLFATRFVAGKTVLDVACGEGYGSALLAHSAAAVVGVDIDPEAVAHARRKYARKNLTFACGAAEAIPLAGQHLFDVIVSFETVEHLTAEAQQRYARELKRLLKPAGQLLISTPNRLIYTDKNQHRNPFHFHEFSTDEFAAFLGQFFTDVRLLCQRVYPASYIWDATEPPSQYTEYQLELADGELQPTFVDRKERLYLIALCSDGPSALPGNSVLLDLDELATRDTSGRRRGFTSTLFVDTGAGFCAEQCVADKLPPGPEQFQSTFVLNGLGPVRGLRWDPLELRTCRVRLEAVEWEDGDGQVHALDLAAVTSNGQRTEAGLLEFDTPDPMVFLPVVGVVARVTVRGWYEADDLRLSLARLDASVRSAQAQLLAHDEELGKVTEARRLASTLFVDTGAGFCAEQCLVEKLPLPGPFTLTFTLNERDAVRELRWDPLESRTCRVRLEAVAWEDGNGQVQTLDLATAASNGQQTEAGLLEFATLDPMVFLPVAGVVARVTVTGWYAVDDLRTSLARRDASAQAQLRGLESQLRQRDEQVRALTETVASARRLTSTLFVDTGAGYRAEQSVAQVLPDAGRFRLSYALGQWGAVRSLRWDPLEGRTCRVRLDGVEWEDRGGRLWWLDVSWLTGNGVRQDDGVLAFETVDPMVYLAVSGEVARVTVYGWYEADDLGTTLARVEGGARTARTQVQVCAEQLRRCEAQFQALKETLDSARGLTRNLLLETGAIFRK